MMSERLEAIGIDPESAACWAQILTDEETSELVQEVVATATVDARTLARILATKDHGLQYHGGIDYSEEGLLRFLKRQLLAGGLGVRANEASTFADEETARLPVMCLKHVLRMLPTLGMKYREQMMAKLMAVIR